MDHTAGPTIEFYVLLLHGLGIAPATLPTGAGGLPNTLGPQKKKWSDQTANHDTGCNVAAKARGPGSVLLLLCAQVANENIKPHHFVILGCIRQTADSFRAGARSVQLHWLAVRAWI